MGDLGRDGASLPRNQEGVEMSGPVVMYGPIDGEDDIGQSLLRSAIEPWHVQQQLQQAGLYVHPIDKDQSPDYPYMITKIPAGSNRAIVLGCLIQHFIELGAGVSEATQFVHSLKDYLVAGDYLLSYIECQLSLTRLDEGDPGLPTSIKVSTSPSNLEGSWMPPRGFGPRSGSTMKPKTVPENVSPTTTEKIDLLLTDLPRSAFDRLKRVVDALSSDDAISALTDVTIASAAKFCLVLGIEVLEERYRDVIHMKEKIMEIDSRG